MKIKRQLSGISFRSINDETKKFDNVVFEDLTSQEQDQNMDGQSVEWLKSLAKQLANTLNEIGELGNLMRE